MVLTALLTGLFAGLTVVIGLLCIVSMVKRQFKRVYTQFITAPDAKTPSPLAQTTDAIAGLFARNIVAIFKTSFMGQNSVDSKMTTRMENALAVDAATAGNPILSMLAQMPTVNKLLTKNPHYALIAQALLNKFTAPAGNGNNHQEPPPKQTQLTL
jgi:hypothetical protein